MEGGGGASERVVGTWGGFDSKPEEGLSRFFFVDKRGPRFISRKQSTIFFQPCVFEARPLGSEEINLRSGKICENSR